MKSQPKLLFTKILNNFQRNETKRNELNAFLGDQRGLHNKIAANENKLSKLPAVKMF